MKILIGYDGSADSEAALKDLVRAGLPAKVQVLLVTVTEPWPTLIPGVQFNDSLSREASRNAEEALKRADLLAEKAAAKLAENHPGWKVQVEAILGSPADSLLRKAEEWRPDLILLGCHGRSAIGRLLMGSVSQKVLHHAHADVRIVRSRKGARATKGPKVLIAVDGSTGSDRAVAAAAAREWPAGTRIRVISALEGNRLERALEGLKAAGAARGRRSHKSWVEQKSDSAARRLATDKVRAVPVVKVGDPRLAILREAEDWGADCIFLGSRGLEGIERFMLGSVSSSVASHAPCTVEVVRKPGRRRA